MTLTLAAILEALPCGFAVEGAERALVTGFAIDSRQVRSGDLFVALRGEYTDGHEYISQAFAAGAIAALAERTAAGIPAVDTMRGTSCFVPGLPTVVVVPDSLQALQQLAYARRVARTDLRVIGVTGSVGKTTTKECIAAVLAQRYATHKNVGNQNNEIGLPLTLLALRPEHQCAVLELGMYARGEIAALCRLAQPHVGVVTNVLPVHLERLGTIENIALAKSELIEALPEEGVAVLNGDDELARAMKDRTQAQVVTYGLGVDNTVYAKEVVSEGLRGIRFVARAPALIPGDAELRAATLGRHSALAALAAVAVGLIEGLGWAEIQNGLLAQGQGVRLLPKKGPRGSTLLDDTYNASPVSVLAALDVLASLPGRRLAVLGDMLELGAYEAQGHREVGQRCAQGVDILLTVGDRAELIAEAALAAGLSSASVHVCQHNAGAIALLSDRLDENDVVLIKGSRGMMMEEITRALEQVAGAHA